MVKGSKRQLAEKAPSWLLGIKGGVPSLIGKTRVRWSEGGGRVPVPSLGSFGAGLSPPPPQTTGCPRPLGTARVGHEEELEEGAAGDLLALPVAPRPLAVDAVRDAATGRLRRGGTTGAGWSDRKQSPVTAKIKPNATVFENPFHRRPHVHRH